MQNIIFLYGKLPGFAQKNAFLIIDLYINIYIFFVWTIPLISFFLLIWISINMSILNYFLMKLLHSTSWLADSVANEIACSTFK